MEFRPFRMVIVALVAAALAVPPRLAAAQPGTAPTPAPPPVPSQPEPPPDPQPEAPRDPGLGAYQAGYAALIAGDLTTARARFTVAAQEALDPELRGAARELGRLTDELIARQGKILYGAAAAGALTDEGEDPADGRTGFVASTTIASLYAGVVLIDLSDTDDARGGAAILLLSTGAGFVASLFGSRGRTITGGTSEAYSTGLLIGAANGLLLFEPLGADSSEQVQLSILGGMALVGGAGFLYGQNYRPTRGQMSFAGTLATLGIASAGLGLVVTNPDIEADTVLVTMAAGLDLGAAAGLVLGKDLTWSSGRARLVWLGALLGAVGGFGTAILIGGDGGDSDGDTYGRLTAGATLAGTWGGFGLATYLTRDMRPDRRYRVGASGPVLAPLAVPRGAGVGLAGTF